MLFRCLLFNIVFFLYLMLTSNSMVRAESLSVSLSVGLTYFVVEGWTSPNSVVTLKEGSSTLATAMSASNGAFSLSILDDEGLHTYSLFSTDPNGKNTAAITHSASLTPGTTTTLSGVVLPPTLTPTSLDASIGQDLHLHGYSVPGFILTIILNGSTLTTAPIQADGQYSAFLSTDSFSQGENRLSFTTGNGSGLLSLPTPEFLFTLSPRASSSPSTSSTPAPISPTPSPSLTPLPLTSRFPALLPFDLNGDGYLTLDELRQMLLRWLQALTNQESDCDLNDDGICNLQDFSILLYFINR